MVSGTDMVGPAEREAVLEATLARHPDAFIGAVAVNGLFVELPAALRERGLRPIEGPASALGLAITEDHTAIVEAWHRLLAEGVANVLFRPRARPGHTARLHLIDVADRHGVVAVIVTGMEDQEAVLDHEAVRPRLVTMRKDQAAVILDADPLIDRVLGWSAAEL